MSSDSLDALPPPISSSSATALTTPIPPSAGPSRASSPALSRPPGSDDSTSRNQDVECNASTTSSSSSRSSSPSPHASSLGGEHGGFNPLNPSSQLLPSRPTTSRPPLSSSTPTLRPPASAGRGAGPSRFGAHGGMGIRSSSSPSSSRSPSPDRASESEKQRKRERQRDRGSQSLFPFGGGMAGGGFMSLIRALAEDERGTEGEEDERDVEARPSEHEEEEEEEDEDPSSADASRAPSPSPPRVDASHLTESSNTTISTDSSTGEPPSFLSPLPSASRPSRARAGTATSLAASVIDAIHRPAGRDEAEAEQAALDGEGGESEKEEEGAVDATERTAERRKRLASKLEEIFGFQEAEEVLAEFPCWLFRSILLQGFLFLTTGHLAFYAYLPVREGKTLRSGALSARGSKTRRYFRHWFVLTADSLSWYPSSTDPYFPLATLSLHYLTPSSIESSRSNSKGFKILKSEAQGGGWEHFRADSEASRDEWVKAIRKAVWRCGVEGESVKIAIPLSTLLSIDRSSHLEFAETIRIRVYDAEEGFSIDEYWLSYFEDLEGALEVLREGWERWKKENPEEEGEGRVEQRVETSLRKDGERGRDNSPARREKSHGKTARWSESLSSRLRLFPSSSSSSSAPTTVLQNAPPASALSPLPALDRLSASATTLKNDARSSSPTSAAPRRSVTPTVLAPSPPPLPQDNDSDTDHHYPPTTFPSSSSAAQPSSSLWNPLHTIDVHSWLRAPTSTGRKLLTGAAGLATEGVGVGVKGGKKIVEVVSRGAVGAGSKEKEKEKEKRREEMSRSVWDDEALEKAEREEREGGAEVVEEEDKVNEKFRKGFGLTEKELVEGQFPAYLFRGLPIYGKIIISTTFLCFKSTGVLAKTRMILPFSDIIGLSKHRSYRIGYSGLIVVIKGHEEIFFELSTSERRDECMAQLEHHVETVQRQLAEGKTPGDTKEHRDHLDLLGLTASKMSMGSAEGGEEQEQAIEQALFRTSTGSSIPHPPPETTAGQPPIMFCSTSSDFVTFRPEKSLRFTCLTIGSRGDVQPYIALCKGLMAEGHKCKIASHGEYRKWVEGHGIAFEEVGGDPAELMQLMIAHDFFTLSFMKEAVGRFRGWLDDLLETTWTACQDTDVLIESPSAIAGYHIAEALRIPYYRAFTMPWSRTRAYPHAFAVPDHKMGGGYNYMTYTMFEQIFWRATSGQVNRWRRKTLGIRSTNLEAMQQHKIPFLYNFSPVVIPPPLDWRENIHVTGYWWLDNPDDSTASKWEPPSDLLAFLDKAKAEDKKVVFVGFGSIIIPDPLEMTRVVSNAVQQSDVYAVVAKGWSDRKSRDDSEETKREGVEQDREEANLMERDYIYNIKSIPHDWLFPRIDAAVHHGGAGTTGASLRAGLPTIIKPFFGDQHFYADRVATLGIGSAVRDMTVANLAEAIIKAVTDEKQISRAKLAGETIRKEDGVGNAIECIYRDLEYAKSLIPAPSTVTSANPPPDSAPSAVESTGSPPRPSTPTARTQPEDTSSPPTVSSHHRSASSSRTNPSSGDEGGWDVVSSSASAVSGRDTDRWDDDSIGTGAGPQSRSRSRSRDDEEPKEERRGLTAAVLEAFGRSERK